MITSFVKLTKNVVKFMVFLLLVFQSVQNKTPIRCNKSKAKKLTKPFSEFKM